MEDDTEIFKLDRRRVEIGVGSLVSKGNVVYRVTDILDFESAIGIAVESGRSVPLIIGELKPIGAP